MTSESFQDKARIAASIVSTMNPAEALAKSLTSEQPKINSAVKSFMSLCAARNLSASDPNIVNASSLHEAIVGGAQSATVTATATVDQQQRKCFFSRGKNSTNPQQAALLCARSLLKAINSFVIPPLPSEDKSVEEKDTKEDENEDNTHNKDEKFEFEVVRIVWNGLVKNNQKPTMFLGLTSLSHVFPLIKESCFQVQVEDDNNGSGDNDNTKKIQMMMFPKNVDLNEAQIFIDEFGDLLVRAQKRKNVTLSDEKNNNAQDIDKIGKIHTHIDDDSCLLWDVDGGKSELERRRKRRELKSAAMKENESKETNKNSNSNSGLTIEEIEE